MVTLAVLGPLLVPLALFALQRLLGFRLLSMLAGSPWVYLALVLVVLAALLAAAYRRRDNVTLMSAWLFLFCGMVLVSLGQLIDLYAPRGEPWSSELVEEAAFLPLLIFALYVAAPLRLLVMPRRRRLLFGILGAALFAAVTAAVLTPWLAARRGASLPRDLGHLLHLVHPLLDVLLLLPVAVFLLALGGLRCREPYPLIGLGLLLTVPADILDHYHLLSGLALQGELAFLLALSSQLYFLGGALICATCRTRERGRRAETAPGESAFDR